MQTVNSNSKQNCSLNYFVNTYKNIANKARSICLMLRRNLFLNRLILVINAPSALFILLDSQKQWYRKRLDSVRVHIYLHCTTILTTVVFVFSYRSSIYYTYYYTLAFLGGQEYAYTHWHTHLSYSVRWNFISSHICEWSNYIDGNIGNNKLFFCVQFFCLASNNFFTFAYKYTVIDRKFHTSQ